MSGVPDALPGWPHHGGDRPDEGERLDRIRLARTPRVGAVGFRTLVRRHGSAGAALAVLPGSGVGPIPGRDAAARELERLDRLGGRMLVLGGPEYPDLLAQIPDPPPLLGVLGDPAVLSRRAIGLVGGRNASALGLRMAEALATDLASSGLVVVSGLARGIDTAAHRGAMFVGTTIACVAGGLDMPYPPENAGLQAEIAERGAVVSEAPPGTAPQSRHFPRRNRIIAGLSIGLVVVEAAQHSGSLITARFAEEAGRMLFAVPGSPLDPRSRGGNGLLREGAVLTEQASDVLAGLARYAPELLPSDLATSGPGAARGQPAPLPARRDAAPRAVPAQEQQDGAVAREAVAALLGAAPTPVDEVVRRCHFSASVVAAALLDLELAGRIETLPGNRVCLLSDLGGTPP